VTGTALIQRRLVVEQLRALVTSAPLEPAQLHDVQRASFAQHLRDAVDADRSGRHRLDAWTVEHARQAPRAFHWTPAAARRTIGNATLRRAHREAATLPDALDAELAARAARAAAGYARPGSLDHWLEALTPAVLALVRAEALAWVATLVECTRGLALPWAVVTSDAYYDLAGARTTLRGRRDFVVVPDERRVVVRLRAGQPGRYAGTGLRVDLLVDSLAETSTPAAARVIGLWPDAGVALAVDGTMANLRAAARALVRTVAAQPLDVVHRAA
jgi:hypothetical protein